jgi:pimeloyl-ACP methyl ester carboxylesterase
LVKAIDPPAVGRLESLAVPTFVLLGAADPTESNDAGRILAQRVPGATIETVPACGHLIPMDCGDDALRQLRLFLQRSGGQAR